MVPVLYLLKLNLFPEKDVQPKNIKLSQSLAQFTTMIHTYIRFCELINLLRNGTIVRSLLENKKTSEKSFFCEAWSPELTSQSFLVPCFL